MDINVAGLNKVYCFVSDSSLNGRTVKITDSINTWTKTISSLSCVFMIPSMPAPAKRTFTVSLMNAAGTTAEYSRQIELGFGDSVKIGLFTNNETADKGYVLSEINSHAYSLPTAAANTKGGVKVTSGTSNGVYMSGEQLQTQYATDTQLGSMKVGTGLTHSSGVVSLKSANSSDIGGVILGNGLQVSSNKTVVKAYNGINVDGTGVGVKPSTGIGVSSSGVYVKAYNGITVDSNGVSVKPSTGIGVSSSGVYLKTADSSNIGGVKPGTGLGISSGSLYIKTGTGLSVDSDGVYLKSTNRSSYNKTCSFTVESRAVDEEYITITDSTFVSRIRNGCVYGLDVTGSTNLGITLRSVSISSNTAYIYFTLINPSLGSVSISSIDVYYWYFS